MEFKFGINYQLLDIGQYNNQISYHSSWVNHPKYMSEIELQTAFRQQYIEVPLLIYSRFNKFSVGVGIRLTYLLSSLFSQKVMGYYYAPDEIHNNPSQYPNSSVNFNKSIRFVLEKHNDGNLAPFHRRNFQPLFTLNYRVNKRISMNWTASYDVLSNPAYLAVQFLPYRLFRNNLTINFQLNKTL